MITDRSGFAHLYLVITFTAVLVVVVIAGWRVVGNKKTTETNSESSSKTSEQETTKVPGLEPLLLKSIGFNIDYYDPETNRAGDMVYTHLDNNLSGKFNKIFADFGTQDPRSPNDPTKRNVQPTFVLPLGTKVLSLVDGIVADVKLLYSNDYTIMVSETGEFNSKYIYETEHIINPTVKIGDKVKAGQVIGEVSTHDSQYHPGFGIMEIGILTSNGTEAQHICPFHYLDPSVKEEIQAKILNIHKTWSEYIGIPNLYDDANSVEPGCFITDPVTG